MAGQATTMAGSLAGQAHVQAHAMAPGIVPAPASTVTVGDVDPTASGSVDSTDDIVPDSTGDKAKFEKLFDSRPDPSDLQEKGILKGKDLLQGMSAEHVGAPDDSLAGKRAELEKFMLEVS